MTRTVPRSLAITATAVVGLASAIGAVAAWAAAPISLAPGQIARTAAHIAQAPFAGHVLIGDSRVARARGTGAAVKAGYGGASARQLVRVAQVLCALAPGRVTVAAGINDTRRRDFDLAASRSAFGAIARHCARDGLRMAQVWPVEEARSGRGQGYAPAAIPAINAAIAAAARSHEAALLRPPHLAPGFTTDGVHFTAAVALRYGAFLTTELAARP